MGNPETVEPATEPTTDGLGPKIARLSMGGALLAVAYATDEMITRWRWGDGEPKIIPYEVGAHDTYADERWLLAPGHGQHNVRPHVQTLMDGAFHNQQLSYFQYSLRDFDVPKMADQLHKFSTTAEWVSLLGNSMGTLTVLAAYLELPEEQRRELSPFGRIVLNSCPFDIDDTHDGKLARTISRVPYGGGVTTKFFIGTVDRLRMRHDNLKQMYEGVRDGLRGAWDDQSPKTWKAQTDFLVRASQQNLMDRLDELRQVITPETQALYCMPDREGADVTVRDRQAYEKWAGFFACFGVQLDRLLLPDAAHADIPRLSEKVGPWLEKTAPVVTEA